MVAQGDGRLHIPLDVEIVVEIGFAQSELVGGQEHFAQSARMPDHQGIAGVLRRGAPEGSLPEAHVEIPGRVIPEKTFEKGQRTVHHPVRISGRLRHGHTFPLVVDFIPQL